MVKISDEHAVIWSVWCVFINWRGIEFVFLVYFGLVSGDDWAVVATEDVILAKIRDEIQRGGFFGEDAIRPSRDPLAVIGVAIRCYIDN